MVYIFPGSRHPVFPGELPNTIEWNGVYNIDARAFVCDKRRKTRRVFTFNGRRRKKKRELYTRRILLECMKKKKKNVAWPVERKRYRDNAMRACAPGGEAAASEKRRPQRAARLFLNVFIPKYRRMSFHSRPCPSPIYHISFASMARASTAAA